jgi:hypothetical protein
VGTVLGVILFFIEIFLYIVRARRSELNEEQKRRRNNNPALIEPFSRQNGSTNAEEMVEAKTGKLKSE